MENDQVDSAKQNYFALFRRWLLVPVQIKELTISVCFLTRQFSLQPNGCQHKWLWLVFHWASPDLGSNRDCFFLWVSPSSLIYFSATRNPSFQHPHPHRHPSPASIKISPTYPTKTAAELSMARQSSTVKWSFPATANGFLTLSSGQNTAHPSPCLSAFLATRRISEPHTRIELEWRTRPTFVCGI